MITQVIPRVSYTFSPASGSASGLMGAGRKLAPGLDLPSYPCPSGAPLSDLGQDLEKALGLTYRIVRELGSGGMSRVFLAEETGLQRHVVVKVLPPEVAAGVNQDRFRREIRLAARLQHPHIVPLLTAGSAGAILRSNRW